MSALLYKFCSPHWGVHILDNNVLYFCSASELNDTYEGINDTSGSVKEHQIAIPDMVYPHRHRFFPEPFWDVDINTFRVMLQDTEHLRLSKIATERTSWQVSMAKISTAGILSLSKIWDNVKMWGLYSSNGAGLAIGFKESSEVFTQSKLLHINGALDIEYSDTMPIPGTGSNPSERIKVQLTHKATFWSFEEEVRCLRPLSPGTHGVEINFQPSDLTEVILGPRTSFETALAAFSYKERNPHVTIYDSFPSSGRYAYIRTEIRKIQHWLKLREPESDKTQPWDFENDSRLWEI